MAQRRAAIGTPTRSATAFFTARTSSSGCALGQATTASAIDKAACMARSASALPHLAMGSRAPPERSRVLNQGMRPLAPEDIHGTIGRHVLQTGLPMVLDLGKSRGTLARDSLSGNDYLDFAGFYGSNALGFNHPKLNEPATRERLLDAALIKVGNPEFYTSQYADFVGTLERTAAPATHPHYFFIDGGALAVENAMKAAMDWKVRKNLARGVGAEGREIGNEILHFRARSTAAPATR